MRRQDEHRAISPLPGTNPAGMTEPSTNPDELSAGTGGCHPSRGRIWVTVYGNSCESSHTASPSPAHGKAVPGKHLLGDAQHPGHVEHDGFPTLTASWGGKGVPAHPTPLPELL